VVSSDNSETDKSESDASSTVSSESGSSGCFNGANLTNGKTIEKNSSNSSEWTLLDLYSGCGAMSTGLCLGATLAGVKLVTVCRAVLLNNLVNLAAIIGAISNDFIYHFVEVGCRYQFPCM